MRALKMQVTGGGARWGGGLAAGGDAVLHEYIGILPLSVNDCSRPVTHSHPHDPAESSRLTFGCTAVHFCDGES